MSKKDRIVYLKSEEELEIIRENGQILGKAHAEVAKLIEPGISTKALDKIAFEYIKDNAAKPSFLNYNGFPASLCISVNEVVVHGIPSNRELKDGDVVSIDCGVYKNGFHADSAYTYTVGNVADEVIELLKHTYRSLFKGIEQARVGNRMGDLSYAIQNYAESHTYGVVRELVGHGVGKYLHEAPEVPNFGKRGNGPKLLEGMVLAIEPMITLGKRGVVQENDNWTIRTEDKKQAAHFEHTVVVRKNSAEILTTFQYIEEVLAKKNLVIA
ncbi:methionine aminopeptidase, type I [Emticicia oligotrophica DSM 17448]|jgi:methionyl aminopeptidase|uniref:Methionine aminopeptidase n=1 Tax=Emticicia oligotrophica (strain DSM 17448 / CIP 109782 / MTCC 6937 / GPTSA100-15) TaxID=929562 RepID=A0ABM5MXD0_EMTOG|nr:type I methionyl aminopeptidase [Emticicia oligotrophica]AFK01648.1 methionine aminopeptidase, type I [Emticicia oligotrophica DSM 17448]